jgi:hypothetical protein
MVVRTDLPFGSEARNHHRVMLIPMPDSMAQMELVVNLATNGEVKWV